MKSWVIGLTLCLAAQATWAVTPFVLSDAAASEDTDRNRVQSVTLADPAMSRPTLVADAAGFALAWADSRGVNVATITCP